jgi:hypothetical protein
MLCSGQLGTVTLEKCTVHLYLSKSQPCMTVLFHFSRLSKCTRCPLPKPIPSTLFRAGSEWSRRIRLILPAIRYTQYDIRIHYQAQLIEKCTVPLRVPCPQVSPLKPTDDSDPRMGS